MEHVYLHSFKNMFMSLVSFIIFLTGYHANAWIGSERSDSNTDIIVLKETDVDYAVRTYYISHAQKTIDMINFTHASNNEVGKYQTKALRTAMNNGVSVRYFFEGQMSVIDSIANSDNKEFFLSTSDLLTDSSLKKPAQLIVSNTLQKFLNGLSMNDYVHEKMIIIDAGTPEEKIFIGGRGACHIDASNMDLGFLIRPLDYTQPYAGTDIKKIFGHIWSELVNIYPMTSQSDPSSWAQVKSELAKLPDIFPVRAENLNEFHEILDLVKHAPSRSSRLPEIEFQPSKSQVFGNDILQTLMKEGGSFLVKNKSANSNDIVKHLAVMLAQAKNIEITSYVIGLPEILKNSVVESLKNGGKISFFTNGREAHALFASGIVANYSEKTYLEITGHYKRVMEERGQQFNPENVQMYFFTPQTHEVKTAGIGSAIYLHQKSIVFDDNVVIGSDNYTMSAESKNDEIILILKDPRLAQYLRDLAQSRLGTVFMKMPYTEIIYDWLQSKASPRILLDNTILSPLIEAFY